MTEGLVFETNRFNLSEEKEHFINPGCFGEDIAAWLRDKLIERGVKARAPGQEDWGWYIEAEYQERWYFISIGGNSDNSSQERNRGEWGIFIGGHRSLWEKIRQQGTMAEAEGLLRIIRELLEQEAGIENVRTE